MSGNPTRFSSGIKANHRETEALASSVSDPSRQLVVGNLFLEGVDDIIPFCVWEAHAVYRWEDVTKCIYLLYG